jgi:hypothetical protein
MGVTGIVIVQQALPVAWKVLGTGKTATGYKATGQHTKASLGLMEPRAMLWCAMQDMPVAGIGQKGPTLRSSLERVGLKGSLAPPGHQVADLQTPGGGEVVHHPVRTLPPGPAMRRLVEMGHAISGRAGGPNGPGHLAGGPRSRMNQPPRAMAEVLMRASLAPACLGRFGRGFALQHLHARLCLAADHQAPLVLGLTGLGVQVADGAGLGITVLIVALEPVRTLVRLEIDVVQETPDTGAAEGRGVEGVKQGRHHLSQRPPRDGAMRGLRQSAGHRDDLDARGSGHSARAPRARGILQTGEAPLQGAPSPCAHREVGPSQLAAHLSVGWLVHRGSPEDHTGS